MASRASKKADRIFVQDGRRLYRRRFSRTEPRIGIAVLVALAAIVGWVAWRGAHPDPSLFALDSDLSQSTAALAVDRGPLPDGLASAGWTEGDVSQFDYDNLYVKINGREGYYKSFGFERLYFLSILLSEDSQTAVDIELYDLGNAANALGAYSGERSPDITPEASDTGLSHIDRNALYLTHGRYYLRAIGSDESPGVRAQLAHLRTRVRGELPGEPLPWGYALFVGRMGMDAGDVAFEPENAFSFGFATNVYTGAVGEDARLFVTPAGGPDEARELAGRFVEGFLQYGTREGDFVKDRYLGTYAMARSEGSWVIGVYRAADAGSGSRAVEDLSRAVKDVPPPAQSVELTTPAGVEEVYEADEY